MFYQSITQYKVPVSEFGTVGEPVFIKGYTVPYNQKQYAAKKAKKKTVKTAQSELMDEE